MELHSQFIIDAGRMGNMARFINHSCNPNCDALKWYVGNNMRIGIFAGRDIPKDAEITYDYQWDHFSLNKVACKCGADNCVGFLGGKPKRNPKPEVSKFGDPVRCPSTCTFSLVSHLSHCTMGVVLIGIRVRCSTQRANSASRMMSLWTRSCILW